MVQHRAPYRRRGLRGLGFMPAALPIAASTGPAAPFVMAAIAAIGPAITLIKGLAQGCGQTCIQASNWANDVAKALEEVKRQYFAQPTRTVSSKVYALQLIDELFDQLKQLCSNPALGDAGRRCISERLVRGVRAKYCDQANPPAPPGECNWLVFYRDPIANDNGTVADPATDPVSALTSGTGWDFSKVPWGMLLAGAVGLYVVSEVME